MNPLKQVNAQSEADVERYLKILISSAPFVFFAISPDGTIKYADGAALKSLGIRANQSIGKNIFDLYKETLWFVDALRSVIREKKRLAISGSVSNGVVDFWYDTQLIPSLNEDGILTEVVGFSIDTTSEKRASERARQVTEEKIAAMTASMDGMAIIALEGTLTYVNDSFVRTYGFKDSSLLIGRNWKTFFDVSEVERLTKVMVPILTEQRHWRGEAMGLKAGGKHFYLEISISEIIVSNQSRGAICVVRDITELKTQSTRRSFVMQAAAALSESLDFDITLRNIANFAVPKFASWCVVTLVNEQGTIERVIVGTDKNKDESAISTLLSDVPLHCSENYINKRVHHTHQIDEAHEVNPTILKDLFPDENERKHFEPLDISAYICVPLLVGSTIFGAITFLKGRKKFGLGESPFYDDEDTTAAIEVAGRMALAVQNAKLFQETKEAVRSREDLIASVSHDLKNPLSAISINAELISRASEALPRATVFKKLSATIRASVDRMTSLIKELLELEKLRGGEFVIVKTKISARSLAETAIAEIEPLAVRKSITLAKNFPARDVIINADRERLLQVFSNLLGNALKFTASNGHVQLSFVVLNHDLKFCVLDNGPGIRREDLDRVFDRYWRSEKSDKIGTGIGLTIARAIVRSHGGRIWVESSPGKGSVFSFTIPCE